LSTSTSTSPSSAATSRLGWTLAVVGGALAVAAALVLWSTEGAAVFAETAFSALLHCL
jgi:hypothetical protein